MTDRATTDSLRTRADRLAQAPPLELPEWMAALAQDGIRGLSVGLTVDLLMLEKNARRAARVARDLERLAGNLLAAGAYAEARQVVQALAQQARTREAPGAEACCAALGRLIESGVLQAAQLSMGDFSGQTWSAIRDRAARSDVTVGAREEHVIGRDELVASPLQAPSAFIRRHDRAEPQGRTGIAAARHIYAAAVETSEMLWNAAQAGDQPDPAAARTVIDSLATLVAGDATRLVALTALKHDNYTFTHMVNVAVLAMAQARSLNVEGPLLREFGLAALMHDIGKVNTPAEVLHKPDRLTKEEFDIMKQHVVDGAHILRDTPEMPALASIVAFEHHLKQDLSGYPENVGSRTLNLCTMIVSIADVFDALRSNRPYRQGLATSRIRAIMGEQGNPAFNQVLLKRFVNLMGLFPVGTLVRLSTEELAVVTAEHPWDPSHPQVKIVATSGGEMLDAPLVNTWEPDDRGRRLEIAEALDPEEIGLDPLRYL